MSAKIRSAVRCPRILTFAVQPEGLGRASADVHSANRARQHRCLKKFGKTTLSGAHSIGVGFAALDPEALRLPSTLCVAALASAGLGVEDVVAKRMELLVTAGAAAVFAEDERDKDDDDDEGPRLLCGYPIGLHTTRPRASLKSPLTCTRHRPRDVGRPRHAA